MADSIATTTGNALAPYLDKAMDALHDMGLARTSIDSQEAPIMALLEKISDLDEARIAAIARTLDKTSLFNDVVRNEVKAMEVGTRYEEITNAFDSIREDAKRMVDQMDDGKLSLLERASNMWMGFRRGDIAERFDKIKTVYLEVAASTNDQVQREHRILEAYQDFRGAMKQSEALALEVLQAADAALLKAKERVSTTVNAVESFTGDNPADRVRLELDRDQALRALQTEDKRYQIAKDLSDNLTVGYNSSEVIMARLLQTTTAKERIYAQAVNFFGTNEVVLTALSASLTSLFGLHEGTQTIEAMKDGMNKAMEDLADIGGKVHEEAVKAGYGPTLSVDSVRKLVDAVVDWQVKSREIIDEMRVLSTENAEQIRETVEQGKRKLARLAETGKAMPLELSKPSE